MTCSFSTLKVLTEVSMLPGHLCIFGMQNQEGLFGWEFPKNRLYGVDYLIKHKAVFLESFLNFIKNI